MVTIWFRKSYSLENIAKISKYPIFKNYLSKNIKKDEENFKNANDIYILWKIIVT